jgi:SM-20-related protein
MTPYRIYRDFFDSKTHAALLAWAIENEAKFQPALIAEGTEDPSQRLSLRVRDFGPLKAMFHQRVLDLVTTLIADLRVTPFEPSKLSLELVANNNGAFFTRHVDTYLGEVRKATDRALSVVYYFHVEPKAFSGGAFRLYGFGTNDAGNFVDIEPDQNTLLAFPSWAWHEVLPVNCPSRRFSDSRFNVNCWVHRDANRSPWRV